MIYRALFYVLAVLLGGLPAFGQGIGCSTGDGAWIKKVCFVDSVNPPAYGHGVLGDMPEWDEMAVFYGPKAQAASDGQRGSNDVSSVDHVFEDIAPRLMDVTGDGRPEAVVVQSSFSKGARLVIYQFAPEPKILTTTPYIGTRFRWLAPIGAADFNGDGDLDFAYIDRPHLAKTLRIWSYRKGQLKQIATQTGLTNHKIGQNFITSGVRACGAMAVPEIVTVDAAWRNVIGTRIVDGEVQTRIISPFKDRASVQAALDC